MPTNDHLFFTAAAAWLRAQVDRIRRSVMAQRPAVRWGAALLVVVGLTSAIYWAATSYSTLERSLSRLGPAVLVGRPDQGLLGPRQAARQLSRR